MLKLTEHHVEVHGLRCLIKPLTTRQLRLCVLNQIKSQSTTDHAASVRLSEQAMWDTVRWGLVSIDGCVVEDGRVPGPLGDEWDNAKLDELLDGPVAKRLGGVLKAMSFPLALAQKIHNASGIVSEAKPGAESEGEIAEKKSDAPSTLVPTTE